MLNELSLSQCHSLLGSMKKERLLEFVPSLGDWLREINDVRDYETKALLASQSILLRHHIQNASTDLYALTQTLPVDNRKKLFQDYFNTLLNDLSDSEYYKTLENASNAYFQNGATIDDFYNVSASVLEKAKNDNYRQYYTLKTIEKLDDVLSSLVGLSILGMFVERLYHNGANNYDFVIAIYIALLAGTASRAMNEIKTDYQHARFFASEQLVDRWDNAAKLMIEKPRVVENPNCDDCASVNLGTASKNLKMSSLRTK